MKWEERATKWTPKISLQDDILEISGSCLSGDSKIWKKMISLIAEKKHKLKILFKIDYFNTVSNKWIWILLKTSQESRESVQVTWYYEEDDEDIKEIGEELRDEFKNIEFIFQEIKL